MRLLPLALPFLLAGCGGIADLVEPPYQPIPIRVFNQAQYEADIAECRAAGVAYRARFSLGSVVAQTVRGATSNTSLIPISPLVPVYGAAGGALGATSDGLDVMSAQHSNVFRNCLADFTRRDGSAVIANPN